MPTSHDVEIPWSELALVLAVARHGSLRAAAQALGVSHPTVSRRLTDLSDSLGVRLFERKGRRLRLTLAGEDLVQTATHIEAQVDALGRRIAGQDHRLEGTVRVALSPSMLSAIASALPGFATRHPGIELEFVTGLRFANVTRREADIAVRITDRPHESLVGRRVSLFEQAAYAHRDVADRLADSERVHWPWIDWDEAHAHHASASWMREHIPAATVVRCDTSMAMFQLVASGAGVGFVPTMLASRAPDLVRLAPEFPVFHRAIWVLTHADLRQVGRFRAVLDWLTSLLHVEGGGVWEGLA